MNFKYLPFSSFSLCFCAAGRNLFTFLFIHISFHRKSLLGCFHEKFISSKPNRFYVNFSMALQPPFVSKKFEIEISSFCLLLNYLRWTEPLNILSANCQRFNRKTSKVASSASFSFFRNKKLFNGTNFSSINRYRRWEIYVVSRSVFQLKNDVTGILATFYPST